MDLEQYKSKSFNCICFGREDSKKGYCVKCAIFKCPKRGDKRLATVAYSVSDILGKQPMISPISGQSS